jgi:hypothetical protein
MNGCFRRLQLRAPQQLQQLVITHLRITALLFFLTGLHSHGEGGAMKPICVLFHKAMPRSCSRTDSAWKFAGGTTGANCITVPATT